MLEPATTQHAAAVLGRVGLFRDLDPHALDALAKRLPRGHMSRGETIYCQGDQADGLHVIIAGKVKVCRRSTDGRDQLLEIRGPADLLGTVSVLDSGPRTATATALTEVTVAMVDAETLRRWMTERPQFTQLLLRLLAERLRQADNHLLDVVFDDVPGRVAKELLQLAQRFGTNQGDFWRVKHDLTQTEIAQLVGATRESVNKALCEFVQRGWITTNGKETLIHHPELLARRAG
ncbi:MAG TPA: Crp/Fnr family transcriptional regulator [Mycobacterium sp.]|nr:Crp/Fnr family transcriptional regulator [Mycobacterium sp.]